MAEIIIAKHRSGSIGEIKLRFRGQFTQFVDWDTITPRPRARKVSSISEADVMGGDGVVPLNDGMSAVMSADTAMFDDNPPF